MTKVKNPIDRFLPKINKTESCWIWIGAKIQCGYGTFGDGRKVVLSHRFSYRYFNGEIPNGLCVCHRCDVKLCVNPDHLFLGTHKDNMQDKARKGRASKKLSSSDILIIRSISQNESVKRFGISQSEASRIKNRKRWSHVS